MLMQRPKRLAGWVMAMVISCGAATAQAAPIRVVILSGQNNHDWKATTPLLEKLYRDSKRFTLIDTVNDVTRIAPSTFAQCDVIVSNWTCHPVMTGGPWTPEGKRTFGDAIRAGKGFVQFHAACAACNDWDDFQEISGLTWKLQSTGHTSYHTFKVVVNDSEHPITKGMSDFWITDELYQKMAKMGKSEFRTLASTFADSFYGGTNVWEPMLITTRLGKGRGVNFLLGHDVQVMQNVAWQTIMLRSTEWAATGKTTTPIPEDWPTTAAAAATVGIDVDAALKTAAEYAFGQGIAPIASVEQLVILATSRTGKTAAATRAELAAKLAATIPTCKTAEAKAFFCKQLAMIGTPAEVPAIAPLLADEHAAMMACRALERIPGPESAKALREAAESLGGELRIGVINAIGSKGDPEAVDILASMAKDADAQLATAAIAALGKIGTTQAVHTLREVRNNAAESMRPVVTDALLNCAERLLADKNKQAASSIFKMLYGPAETPRTRAAALNGLVNSEPRQATMILKEALDSKLPELHTMVAFILRNSPKVGDTREIASYVLRLSQELQVLLIGALAERGDQAAASSLRRALDADKESVRVAAIQALTRLGDETDVSPLIGRIAEGSNIEKSAAEHTLAHMPSDAVEQSIAGLFARGDDRMRAICGPILIKRRAVRTLEPLLKKAKADNDVVLENAVNRLLGFIYRDPPTYRWHQAETSVALLNHDAPVWQFNYSKEQPHPYFHPLNLPDGTELVWLNPPDHPHHHALWFAWNYLNNASYWAKIEGHEEGRTEITRVNVVTRPDFSATIDMDLVYHLEGKPPVLTETRMINVYPPRSDGSYKIDWAGSFTAGADDVFMKGGTAGGGYAGLSVRISKDSRDWELLDSEGRSDTAGGFTTKHTHGQRSRWADFTLVSTLTGNVAGIAIFDHPDNLRYPSQWHDIMGDAHKFGYFSPAPLWSEPYTLPAGKLLSLQYRILVHPGRSNAKGLEAEFEAFRTTKH